MGNLGGTGIRDSTTYAALNNIMAVRGVSWCDRCRVFALHSEAAPPPPPPPGSTAPTVPSIETLFAACRADVLIANTVGAAPDPDLRLDANTCAPCPPGFTSDANGVCVFCPHTIVGNRCVECQPDVVRDGNTMMPELLNAGFSIPGDQCPNIFWLQVDNPLGVYTRGATDFQVGLSPTSAADSSHCNRTFTLFNERSTPSGYLKDPPLVGVGSWSGGGGLFSTCANTPVRTIPRTELEGPNGATFLRFGTPTDPRTEMDIGISGPVIVK
jgi:hypothetical protein